MSPRLEPDDELSEEQYFDIISDMLRHAAGGSARIANTTELYRDLDLWGDDANEFLLMFEKRFDIKTGGFVFEKSFPADGEQVWLSIKAAVAGKRIWEFYAPVTVADLIRIARTGTWDL